MIAENQVPSFFSASLWKSILFWFVPLLAFFSSAYIVAFSKDSLIFNVWSCSVLLHPIVSIPICVTIEFVLSWFKICWNKCQLKKWFGFFYTMPLHLAVICLCQIFLTLEWSTFHEEFLLTSNLTLRASFDNYFSFDQCCHQNHPCGISSGPGLDIGGFIANFVTEISKLVDETNLSTTLPIVYYILIATTILLVIYFMIECCIGNLIPTVVFIIGPPLNNDKQQETEKSIMKNGESEAVMDVELSPISINSLTTNNQKKTFIVSQIVCSIFVTICIIALLWSPGLFHQALTSKLVICHDGLWDSNPDESLNCVGMFNLNRVSICFIF